MPHINPEAFGLFPGVDLKIPTGSWAQGVCVDDWNGDNFDHTGLGFISGGMFTAAHELLKPIGLEPDPPARGAALGLASGSAGSRDNARSVGVTQRAARRAPLRGQSPRPRPGRHRRPRTPTRARDLSRPRARGSRSRVSRREARRVAARGGRVARRGPRAATRSSCARPTAARGWATTPTRRSSIGSASRTRSRTCPARDLHLPDVRRAQPDAHAAGAGLADGRAAGGRLLTYSAITFCGAFPATASASCGVSRSST